MRKIRHGVYVYRDAFQALRPWEKYLVRVHAVAHQHPSVIFCLESAAAIQGLPLFGQPRDIHVLDEGRTRSRRFGDIVVHTSQDTFALWHGDGLTATAPHATAVHLMRLLPPAFALAVGDAVVRDGHAAVTELIALADSQASRRGVRQLRWLWERIDPRAESVGESVSRPVIEWCGFETPDLQETFRFEGEEDRVDFFWRLARRAGESDGYGKYRLDSAAGTEQALIAEKRREDRLRRHLAGFARWDYGDVMNWQRLAGKLASAGVPVVARPQYALLDTLRTNPRSQ